MKLNFVIKLILKYFFYHTIFLKWISEVFPFDRNVKDFSNVYSEFWYGLPSCVSYAGIPVDKKVASLLIHSSELWLNYNF